jgi:hypothetical protein
MRAVNVGAVVTLGALAMVGCTPDWAGNDNSEVVLLMTGINDGEPLASDVGNPDADFVALRLENHFKNPGVTNTGFRHDFTVERYEVRYYRSDGRGVEGVDIPFSISGNLAQEVTEENAATLVLEVVRAQAKLEQPLMSLRGCGGARIVTMFADITLHARTTTGTATNPVSARLQIDFADFSHPTAGICQFPFPAS